MEQKIEVDQIGIASVLSRYRLRVPPNQREYSWDEDKVSEFLQDISNAMRKQEASYFLGTIVLTAKDEGVFEVADGQQRLATTSMVLAVLRNLWYSAGDEDRVRIVEYDHLFKVDARTTETRPRLTLNLDDNDYFLNRVLLKKTDGQKDLRADRRSHRLITGAMDIIREHFETMKQTYGGTNFLNEFLVDWLEFLQQKANVVLFCVPSSANAFRMFETLNDRGLKTSQADLVKNYLFDIAGDRRLEAQHSWSSMHGAVESQNSDDDLIMDFLRLSCSVFYGQTRERDVMERVQQNVKNKTAAMALLSILSQLSMDYAAILNADHPKWAAYDESAPRAIKTINTLGVTQLRPLMLAVARYFKPTHAAQIFRNLVAWSVRFLVEGERGSKLDVGYAKLANSVHNKGLETATDLQAEASRNFVPTDATFEAAFQTARVGKSPLARYYLRALELEVQEERYPELIPNDSLVVSLEHIMPKELSEFWPDVTQQDIETHCARIGNLALLTVDKNSKLGNESFNVKKQVYRTSAFALTNQLATFDRWNTDQIEARQKTLAKLAVKAWPLK